MLYFGLTLSHTRTEVPKKYSPRYIMTGQHLSFAKHTVIEFGAYVQMHEEHGNDMNQHTMGSICLGPTGSKQGAHWFMSLSSGERVVRYQWTELPMPWEAINCVLAIRQRQGMPSTITYANRHSLKIANTINDFEDKASDSNSSYVNSDQEDVSTTSDFDNDSNNNTTDNSNSDLDDDDDPDGRVVPHPPQNPPNRPQH
jgi:hypothetical protein